MMMFSLRPIRLSPLPSMAASVSTRVVSWNDAADSHDSVASDALVMPMISGRPSAGRLRLLDHAPVGVAEHLGVDPLAGQEPGVARLLHADPAGHLAHDELDVLVVDRHALLAVHLLDLLDEVVLRLADALDLDELLRVGRTVGDRVTGGDLLAVGDDRAGADGQDDLVLLAVVRRSTVTGMPLPSSSPIAHDAGALGPGWPHHAACEPRTARRRGADRRRCPCRPHHRCGTYASSAGYRAHRSTGRR